MDSQKQGSTGKGFIDRFGAVASSACALHCAICALVPATFTALGLSFLVSHEVEWILTGVAVLLGLFAVFHAWRSHGNVLVLVTLGIGVIGLLAARGLEGGHHDGHEAAATTVTASADEHAASTTAGAHHGAEASHHDEGHHDEGHLNAELFGVLAGVILCLGHIINLREWKRAGRRDLATVSSPHC